MAEKSHTTRFAKNTKNGLFKAVCSCGWVYVGTTLPECQTAASSHDLWEEIPAEKIDANNP